jgi:hypothetical protein
MFCTTCGNGIEEGARFCTKCGSEIEHSFQQEHRPYSKTKLIMYCFAFLVIGISAFSYWNYQNRFSGANTDDIASSVINIFCEGASEENASGGSGTIFTEDGIVLTNAHVIPTDFSNENGQCLVILLDSSTGSPKEIYYAYPIVAPRLSDKYDLAFMQIHDVYYDSVEGKAYGEYPKKFPAYAASKRCGEENIKLGEPVRIYGYPAISGGDALTVTDGVVSSLLVNDGLIITSAKISHGNSGGLAVDKNGCMIGVPSMVTSDENESLGVIISTDLISQFFNEVKAISN